MSQLRKYKTSLYHLHKGLKDVISKDELEEQIKDIAMVYGSASEATSTELSNLIRVVYLVADDMGINLKEDEGITFNW